MGGSWSSWKKPTQTQREHANSSERPEPTSGFEPDVSARLCCLLSNSAYNLHIDLCLHMLDYCLTNPTYCSSYKCITLVFCPSNHLYFLLHEYRFRRVKIYHILGPISFKSFLIYTVCFFYVLYYFFCDFVDSFCAS